MLDAMHLRYEWSGISIIQLYAFAKEMKNTNFWVHQNVRERKPSEKELHLSLGLDLTPLSGYIVLARWRVRQVIDESGHLGFDKQRSWEKEKRELLKFAYTSKYWICSMFMENQYF